MVTGEARSSGGSQDGVRSHSDDVHKWRGVYCSITASSNQTSTLWKNMTIHQAPQYCSNDSSSRILQMQLTHALGIAQHVILMRPRLKKGFQAAGT